jgi:hypothetical protein
MTLRFKPMLNGQGQSAMLPDGRTVIQWDERHFAVPIDRYELLDRQGCMIATGATLAELLPSASHESTLQALGRRLAKARQAKAEAMDEIRTALPQAIVAGVTEVDAARLTGLDRMTIRKMLGKDPRRGQSAG